MKKIINILIIVSVFLTLTACNNYKDYTFELKEDNTYEITKYEGEAEELLIPSSYKGKAVTSIGVGAFRYNQTLNTINLPDSITIIGKLAFVECRYLKNITIPNSVTSIGEGAFFGCVRLLNFDMPDSLINIGESAFWYCERLTNITIPEGVTNIGMCAFSDCANLDTIIIPTSVETLPSNVFQNCDKLAICIKSEIVPDGWAQEYSNGRKTTILGFISYGVTAEGFEYGISKINGEYFASIVGYIQGYYTSISIPTIIEEYSVKRIASRCSFSNIIDRININIPNGVERIESQAFTHSGNLQTITIPESVIYVGRWIVTNLDIVTIRVKSESKPEGWHSDWNLAGRPVIWGYTGE